MRKVVSPSDVAHFFANQTQYEATNSGRTFYYEGDKIYSYGRHFCIARIHEGKMLFTKRTYSNTTSNHVSHVWQASRHWERVMCYFPESEFGSNNFSHWRDDINAQLLKLGNARKPELYLSPIKRLIDEVKAYADFMGFEIPASLYDIVYSPDIELMLINKAAKIKEIQDAHKREAVEKAKIEVEKFRNFEVRRIHGTALDVDYLRVSVENGFETSQGIEISIEEGLRLYIAIKHGKLKRGDSVKHYTVRSIDSKMLVVGCHNIPIKEIDSVIDSNTGVFEEYYRKKENPFAKMTRQWVTAINEMQQL